MKHYDKTRLAGLLDDRKMTFQCLAREVRMRTGNLCTTQTVKRWVEDTAPSANILCALSDVFDVPMEYFFSDSEDTGCRSIS